MDDTLERLKAALAERYDVERLLGAGGMAAVFLARDIKHDRQVAIKVLHAELAATIGAERFEREIRTAAKLQHPNILGMFDSGEANGMLYYVMPFVQGESLRDRLDRDTQLPVEEAVQLALEVADALGHAHAQGIVHRDIKPENILLSGGHALVADFGIARAAGESSGSKLTQTGMALGTPVYMAPEQSVGEVVGPTADLYSLGCMLYEMLAGEPPFTGKNGAAIMAKHALEAVPSIRIVRQSVPEEVEQAIFAAMGKVPADRPQSAAEFMEILGVPMGATATRRSVMRVTSTSRVPTGATPAFAPPEPAAPAPLWKRPWAVAVATTVVIGAAFGGYQLLADGGATSPAAGGLDPARIAVLYLADLSPDSSLSPLAEGLTEGLIGSLTGVPGLTITSRGGVDLVRGSTLPLDEIADSLRVGTIIRGEVQPDRGTDVRVSLEIVDGNTGGTIGRTGFAMPASQLIAVRDSVTQSVAALVRNRLGTEIRLSEQRAETRNADAWSLFQRAEQHRRRGEAAIAGGDAARMDQEFNTADSLLATAEQLDPRWIRPIIGRANLDYQRSRLLPRDLLIIGPWIDRGMEDIERALVMDSQNPDALELRGNLRYWRLLVGLVTDDAKRRDDLLAAKADFERATERNPLQAGAWASLSHLYNQTSSGVEVMLAARRALDADAFLSNAVTILDRLFLTAYDLESFPDAERYCRDTRDRFPHHFFAPRCELYLLTTRVRAPDTARARALADSMVEATGTLRRPLQQLHANMLRAAVLARAADSAKARGDAPGASQLADDARRLVRESLGTPSLDPSRDLAHTGAFVSAMLGDRDEAIRLLGLYLATNEPRRASYALDPGWWFRSLRDDPRFIRLVGTSGR